MKKLFFCVSILFIYSPAMASNILLQDDFNDGVIASNLWTVGGSTVYERKGVLDSQIEVTDSGGSVRSQYFEFNPTEILTFERDIYLHYSNNYFIGRLHFDIEGESDYLFGVNYANMAFAGTVNYGTHTTTYSTQYGTSLFKKKGSGHVASNVENKQSESVDTIWNDWFHETIKYDPVSGDVNYFINDQLELTYNVGALPNLDDYNIRVYSKPWGWYTGHFQYMDNVVISQKASASPNVDVSVSPTTGPQGTTFSQSGTGFTPNNAVTLHFNGPDGPSTDTEITDSNGAYFHSWLCDACPVGEYSYYAVDDNTGQSSKTVNFTVNKDDKPYFDSASLPASVVWPNEVSFSGTAWDENGLSQIRMSVDGTEAFTESISGTSQSLGSYYFNSSDANYANQSGNYTVTLTLTDNAGLTESKNFSINVSASNTKPYFDNASLPSSATMPDKVYFSGYAKDDYGLSQISMKVIGPAGTKTAFTENISGTSKNLKDYYFNSSDANYANMEGNYTVTLTIIDNYGKQTIENFQISVYTDILASPILSVEPDEIASIGTEMTLSWPQVPYSEGYKICYGFSTGIYSNCMDIHNVNSFTFQMNDLDLYVVVVAYDGMGNESLYSNELNIQNSQVEKLLIQSFEANPTVGILPLEVNYEVKVSGGTPPYTYDWNFGDGQTGIHSEQISHTFYSEGIFTTSVEITDSNGQTTIETKTIHVNHKLDVPILEKGHEGFTVSLSWSEVENATGYKLYYADFPKAQQINSLDLGTQTKLTFELWNGAEYFVAIKAYNADEHSDYSNIEVISYNELYENINVCSAPSMENLFLIDNYSCVQNWNLVNYLKIVDVNLYGDYKFFYNKINDINSIHDDVSRIKELGENLIFIYNFKELSPDQNIEKLISSAISAEATFITTINDNEYGDILIDALEATTQTLLSGGTDPTPVIEYAFKNLLQIVINTVATLTINEQIERLNELSISKEYLNLFYRYGGSVEFVADHLGLEENSNSNDIIKAIAKNMDSSDNWWWFQDYNTSNVLKIISDSKVSVDNWTYKMMEN